MEKRTAKITDIILNSRQAVVNLPYFFKYLIVGGLTFLIDLGALFLLHGILKFDLAISATISFWLSILFNFTANRVWVFDHHQLRQLSKHMVLYGMLLLINYLYTIVAITFLTRYVNYGIAKIIILGVQIAWTFPIYKYIIFKNSSHKTEEIK